MLIVTGDILFLTHKDVFCIMNRNVYLYTKS